MIVEIITWETEMVFNHDKHNIFFGLHAQCLIQLPDLAMLLAYTLEADGVFFN